ncbi:anti-CBASS protein Acb1 family protein [Sphingomonas koreensis]
MAWLTDSLRSVLGAVGQRMGLNASTGLPNVFSHQLAIAAYMCSGMMRKVIRVPAADRTQKWRDWQTDKDTISLIEAEEKRLNLRAKVKHAEILRGVGGGALVMITAGDHDQPLRPETISKGGLIAVNVASRWEIQATDFDLDLASPTYGEPRMFSVSGGKEHHDIHPSRVICFRGDPVPQGSAVSTEEAFWGDSKLLQVYQAVTRSDNAKEWFAALVKKAKLLRIGIPDLDQMDETRLNRRIEVIALGESSLNATVYRSAAGTDDAGEKIDDYQMSWTGIPDMMDSFDHAIAAVSDIPFTRLTGRSPAGMNATGQHDMDNWHDAVRDGQETETRPCLEKLDPVMLRSAGIADPSKVWWEWAPLDSPTEKEKAETFKILVDAIEKLMLTGLVPEEAMARAVQNLLEERGDLPGLADALKLLSEDERFGLSTEPDDTDPSAIEGQQREGGDPESAGRGGGSGSRTAARRAANDARFSDAVPRTLYVRRDVVNVADFKAWARAQGLPELQDGLHVTIAYSRTPIDWMKIDGEWNQDEKGQLTVQPGGVRIVEALGDRTAVLLFTSSALSWRHESIVRAGASHEYPDYQPHISLTGEAVDLAGVEPYRGKIVLGPEIFEEVRP